MKIRWLGHAAFLLTTGDGLRIITDPYGAAFKGILSYQPLAEWADIVTVSHQHGDHNEVRAVQGDPTVVAGDGRHESHGIDFFGVATFHDRVGGAERGRNTVMVMDVDGLRIAHAGDLGHTLTAEQLSELGAVNILMLPTGGPPATIDLDEADEIWRQTGAEIVIPMHYRNACCHYPEHGLDAFLENKTSVMQPTSSEVELDKSTMPAEGTVLALQADRT